METARAYSQRGRLAEGYQALPDCTTSAADWECPRE
ncbi:hypothetical protein P3T26_003028 [Streptomyces sp. MAA16]|nr:hypothetical protein [Streptomyces sp. MAA16]